MNITKEVIFVAKEGCIPQLKELLEMMVTPSRQELGCLFYTIYQRNDEPDTFVVVETWENDEALKGHQNSAHYAHYKAHFEPFTKAKSSSAMTPLIP